MSRTFSALAHPQNATLSLEHLRSSGNVTGHGYSGALQKAVQCELALTDRNSRHQTEATQFLSPDFGYQLSPLK